MSASSESPSTVARSGRSRPARASRGLFAFWRKPFLSSIGFWTLVSIVWGALLAWDGRYAMNPDGLSYLDMAGEAGRGGLISAYWSPLYPALIAAVLTVLRPSPDFEFPAIHFLNWLIFIATTLSFSFFLRAWLRRDESQTGGEGHAFQCVTIPFAFCLFLWAATQLGMLALVSPDLCVAAFVFLICGICCRLGTSRRALVQYLALGGVLGLAYYAKTAMFPAAILLLACLFLFPPTAQPNRRGLLLALAAFLLTSAPCIAIQSKRLGYPSIGAAGSLNYAWYVNRLPQFTGWIEPTPDHGTPTHSPRVLMQSPLTLEFASPIPGTYPLWYDPSYWYEGAKPRFDLRQQLAAVKENLPVYEEALRDMSSLCAGILVLAFIALERRTRAAISRRCYWAFLWSIAVAAMYTCVHLEYRFMFAFLVLFWMAAYRSVMGGRTHKLVEAAVLSTVIGALLIPALYFSGVKGIVRLAKQRRPDYMVAAEGLRGLGIQPGDRLATVGYSFDAYYARLTRARIVAQIPEAESFWRLGEADLKQLQERLAGIGVKALVLRDKPDGIALAGWHEIPGTRFERFSVLRIRE